MELETKMTESTSETQDVNARSVHFADNIEERHPRAILQSSPSTISFDFNTNLPRTVLDHLDDIYTCRAHRRCIDWSYLTLLSMTIAVFGWMAFWLTNNRCENLSLAAPHSFLCSLVTVFEVIIIGAVCLIPLFLVLMIRAWLIYACRNPFDPIRQEFIAVKLQGDQWRRQVEYYLGKRTRVRWFSRHRRQRKELLSRGCGHVILSPHGIVVDEIAFLSTRSYLFLDGILLDGRQILKLNYRHHRRPCCKQEMEISLSDEYINQQPMEELENLLNIQINTNAILLPRF